MPRQQDQQVSDTPFASVLTAYMWSRQPPWSAAKTAAVLGIHRARVAKWVYGGITPEIETMLVVMARLNIPMRFLLDAYAARGIPVPPLDVTPELRSAQEQERASSINTIGEAASQFYRVPAARRGRGGGKGNAAGVPASSYPDTPGASPVEQAVQPEPTRQEESAESAESAGDATRRQEERDWDTMMAHTRTVMSMGRMPASVIESMLAEIEDARRGAPSDAQRRADEEHTPPQRQQTTGQTAEPEQRQGQQTAMAPQPRARHPHLAR